MNNTSSTDCASDAQEWRVVSAAIRGTSHVKSGQPCQDRLRFTRLPGRRLLAVLADGAGSAAFAEVGAEIAVDQAIVTFQAWLATAPPEPGDDEWKNGLREALTAARAAVLAEARKRAVAARELASTLAILLVAPGLVVAAQIGDGASVAGEADGGWLAVTRPGQGEYINETTFLTGDDALAAPQLEVRHGRFQRAALLSDGLQMLALKLPETVPHAPFFAPLFRFVESVADVTGAPAQLEAFLLSPRITQRTDDDLTLLLAALVPPAAG